MLKYQPSLCRGWYEMIFMHFFKHSGVKMVNENPGRKATDTPRRRWHGRALNPKPSLFSAGHGSGLAHRQLPAPTALTQRSSSPPSAALAHMLAAVRAPLGFRSLLKTKPTLKFFARADVSRSRMQWSRAAASEPLSCRTEQKFAL